MEHLLEELVIHVTTFLPTSDKLCVLSTCRVLRLFKNKLLYTDLVWYYRVRHLSYRDRFTRVIVTSIINFSINVTEIQFADCFNEPIGKLPTNLISLTLGTNFNQPIVGSLPPNLLYLQFGHSFNRSIQGALPPKLISLRFGHAFNCPIAGYLPPNLRFLFLQEKFNRTIQLALPPNLVILRFFGNFKKPIVDPFPPNLIYLRIPCFYDYPIKKTFIPPSMKLLTIYDGYKYINDLKSFSRCMYRYQYS